MKTILLIFANISIATASLANAADSAISSMGELFRVEANPQNGFHHPFFIYIPKESARSRRLLVVPNNTGSSQMDMEAQIRATKRQALIEASTAERTKSILLVPVFPRPNVEPPIYTHALSRSSLEVKDGPLRRVDIQLVKMIETARRILKKKYKIELKPKIFLSGFSASASFVSRFAFLHPELVAAISSGSPGGWPIAPATEVGGKQLTYPVGIADVKELVGKEIDLKELKKVSFFFFIGDKDENDSVPFRDSFSEADEKLIFEIFGKNPVSRWPRSEDLYLKNKLNAKFKTYPGVAHEVPLVIREDVIAFFNQISDAH